MGKALWSALHLFCIAFRSAWRLLC